MAKKYYQCQACGKVFEAADKPNKCPLCGDEDNPKFEETSAPLKVEAAPIAAGKPRAKRGKH
jgi:rubredoxin